MFKSSVGHLEGDLFSFENDLSSFQQNDISFTKSSSFYENIFCKIVEEDFSVLYSDKYSRPNSPINSMVSSLILREMNNWTFKELFENIHFNLLTKKSLGLTALNDIPFSYGSLFNFQNKLSLYFKEKDINLFDDVFKKLTENELNKLDLKTDIQRTDSTLISSNIRRYSRLQLMIEVLIRFSRDLTELDKLFISKQLSEYTALSSEKYIYNLSSKDLPHEFQKIGELYHKLYLHFKDSSQYSNEESFKLFNRVYSENFKIVDEKLILIPANELKNSLQSPDDPDATYRKKGKEESRGYVVNVVETANQENKVQLITDVCVEQNTVADTTLLNSRLDEIKEKTPDIKELHTDGGYGSKENDIKMKELGIDQIQTAVKGKKSNIDITIEKNEDDNLKYNVKCPNQEVISEPTKKRNKAIFDKKICSNCEFSDICNIHKKKKKSKNIFYFTEEDFNQNKRKKNIDHIPIERRQIRNNVEATMHEFKYRRNHKGKLKVRKIFKVVLFAFTTAISINFSRAFRYNNKKINLNTVFAFLRRVFCEILENLENQDCKSTKFAMC